MTRAQRARIGVHLNRRQPSEQDYAHFALYQANQKAYEATFLKHFVNHALHPSQIEQCLQDSIDVRESLQKYIASVSANIKAITNKMIWNAHCRTVNLLANAGKDGAPFWDVCAFDRMLFADFSPSNAGSGALKMKESWHLTAPKPSMVRYTTKDYPIGQHISPFEEIDEVADTLFCCEAFGSSLPNGRVVKQPTKRKAKGQDLPGARLREPIEPTRRDNWLASLVPPVAVQEYREPSPTVLEPVDTHGNTAVPTELRILEDLHQPQSQATFEIDTSADGPQPESLHPSTSHSSSGPTQLEQLFSQFGANALSDHYPPANAAPSQEQVEQVPTWPTRLLQDHKRRLTVRSPQVFRRALLGIRAVIAEAITLGYRPVDPEFEELIVDIKSREQSDAASAEILGEARVGTHDEDIVGGWREMPSPSEASFPVDHNELGRNAWRTADVSDRGASQEQSEAAAAETLKANTTVRHPEQESETSDHGSSPCKKRKREQPAPIRMFKKPIKRSKKQRKAYASVLSTAGPSTLPDAADRPRKQKITTSVSCVSAPKMKPAKQQIARPHTVPVSSPTPIPPHPSGSTTLEPHQHLPPDASFMPQSPDEKPVWRCGIKHALGHYYNAGDRKNCPGCFTALSDNTSAVTMDFYLPSRTHYHQPNPTTTWRPSKPFGVTYNRARRSKHLSHNSIAKEAYWAAISAGSSLDDARATATAAVLTHLAPKPPPKEPTPAPTPTPEPDPGPHPSGSATMEHGQDTPSCAYFGKRERHEEFAWRCDVNHALGRYYLAGDKRSCPGCGSNKGGLARHAVMDFYLPPGVVMRQEVQAVQWRARRPYKMREGRKDEGRAKKTESTHNQVASRQYWGAVDAGRSPDDALAWAVRETDRWLDECDAKKQTKSKTARVNGEGSAMTASTALNAARQRDARSASVSDEDIDEAEQEDTDDEMHDALIAAFEESSSSDSSSESDSE